MEGEEAIREREALVEMYKAGFLDAYSLANKLRKAEDWKNINEKYKLAFYKRFEKKITKALKKK